MRFGVSVVSLLAALAGVQVLLAADRQMPYKAYVVSDGAYVRSGPGKNYYPTMKLPLGAEVEVYRHDPGGWYAIKPPEESFAWVAARYVETSEDGLGTITGEQVAARVGSSFSDIRDVIQVRLHEGEVVEILGEKQFTGTSEAGRWYRIAPPAGEFRWIFGRMVDADYMTSGVRESAGNTSPLLLPPRAPVGLEATANERLEEPARLNELQEPRGTGKEVDFAVLEPAVLDLSEERIGGTETSPEPAGQQANWVASDGEVSDPAEPRPVRAERIAAHEEAVQSLPSESESGGTEAKKPLGYVSPRIPELNETAEEAPRPVAGRPSLPFGEALERLEFELTGMLAEEPTVWSLTELEIQAQSLLERASTALERGKVRLLLKKIAQSNDVKQRYAKFVDSEVQLDRREQRLESLRAEPGSSDSQDSGLAPSQAAPRYDGYGRLGRVVTSDTDAPRYALVDASGKVTCFVTPAPGLNLDNYVGDQIGVVGTSGYIPKRQARHVTAKHVTPLDTALR